MTSKEKLKKIKRGEELFADGWRFVPTCRIPKQGNRKGWMTFEKGGASRIIQVSPEIGSRILKLELEQRETEDEL